MDSTQTDPAPVARYRKTRDGSYVVMAPWRMALEAKQNGGQIVVTKRDGSTKQERCESYGKRFDVDGVLHVYIRIPEPAWKRYARQAAADTRKLLGECANLDCRWRYAYTLADDSSGIVRPVCDRCARLDRMERQFA